MFSRAAYYLKMSAGLARLQRSPRLHDPVDAIRDQMRHREERFLAMARSALDRGFYRELFTFAGCSYADLEYGVRRDGIRATLVRLAAAGVYVTHDEFRGRTDLVRGNLHIPWNAKSLDNPTGRGTNPQSTSGSTGKPFVTSVSNDYLLYRDGHELLEIRALDSFSRPHVIVAPVLPVSWPIRRQVIWHRLGISTDRWFALAAREGDIVPRVVTRLMIAQTRLLGAAARYPEHLPPNDFTPVADCLARYRATKRLAFVRTMPSLATRIAAAARENGWDISGSMFSVSGEPLTALKRQAIESSGAEVYSFYGATEFGHFGHPCRTMRDGDRVHLFEDSTMLVSHRADGAEQHGLFVTSLLPLAPRTLINVGVDDSAVIEPAVCDCEYQRLGFTMQARAIFSYGKVTTQGTTIEAAELADLIEAALPARFGGASGDYQLAEVDGAAQSELLLRVSPRLRNVDPVLVRDFFLDRLGGILGGRFSRQLWEFSAGLRVAVEEPEHTSTGKVHPVRLRSLAFDHVSPDRTSAVQARGEARRSPGTRTPRPARG